MLDWWDKNRECLLLTGAVIAFALLIVIKVKLDVPAFMTAPEWSSWVAFFRSDAFEDVAGDLLVGFIAAYFFYVLIDLIPRRNRDRKAQVLLSTLLSSHLETFLSGEIRGHAQQINEFRTLQIEDINTCKVKLQGEMEARSLRAAAHMSRWGYQRISESLQVALSLGIEHAQLWLEITDSMSKLKYLAEGADATGLLQELRSIALVSDDVLIKPDLNDAMGSWGIKMSDQMRALVTHSERWLKLSGI